MNIKIIKQQIALFDNSAIVAVDRLHGWVTITADKFSNDSTIFLQDDEGYNFINKADELFNQGELSMDECYRFYAYDYLDLLGE
jgi:hypothetical protein